MCLVVVIFCALPYMSVGKLTSHGYGYTWLFGIDLLGRSDYVSAMMVKLPPDNLWMSGVPLRMYLVGYAIPAFAYAASGRTAPLHSLVLLETLGLSLLMLGCLFILLRKFFRDQKILVSVGLLGLLSYSYYWLYDAAKWIIMKPGQRGGMLSDPYFWNYDGVSHLFQRSFLVEPQTALTTSLLLIMFSMLVQVRYKLDKPALGAFLGVCLGICFGTDAMQGLVIIAWFGFLYLGRFIWAKGKLHEEYVPFLAAVIACGLVAGSFFLMGMYQPSTSHLVKLKFNSWIVLFGLLFFPVEFGPLIILGVWGMIYWWRRNRLKYAWPLLLMAAVALTQVALFEQFPNPRTRMADRFLPIVFLVFAGYLFRYLWSSQGTRVARWLAVAVVLAGIPTFFTDIHFASAVQDEYHTHYVRIEDRLACDWIRRTLPDTAVIQGEPQYFSGADHGRYLNLIASFAARPQVSGWYSGAAVLVDKGWEIGKVRRRDILAMLSSSDATSVLKIVRKYSINYLYVGPFEQEGHKQLLTLLQGSPQKFREVYNTNGVHIFECLGNAAESASIAPPHL
jgi:hypothetical protein